MESIMMSSPHIRGITMFGSKHDQVGVLIEPSPLKQIDITDAQQVAHFINLIWPVICEANQRAPAFSKIYKEMIVVTDRHKPLPRTPKGTVMRAQALGAYAAEIEARYTDVASMRDAGLAGPPQVWDHDCLVEWLLRQVRELCPGVDISITKSLFDQGVDSLSSIILRRRIVGALASAATRNVQDVAQNMIYQYPTINALAVYVLELTQDPGAVTAESVVHARVQAIEDMIRKYSLPEPAPPASSDTVHGSRVPVVLLTGSTGHLGAHILQQLLRDPRDPRVERVYAVNRASPPGGRAIASRHVDRFRDLGFDEQLLLSATLVHIETDTAAPRLGLADALYEELCGCVTAVIHLAWVLDFNFPLAAFEAHVRGVHHLLALARASGAKFVFASSVGAAQAWEQSAGLYPEEVVLDAKYAVGNGYGEGKYVTERIIAASGLDATSLRIGQISGSGNGAWAVSDWVPILVKSGLALGCLPRAHGTVSWLPPHIVAACALAVMLRVGRAPAALNVVHPRGTPWDTVMAYIIDALHRTLGVRPPLVPFAEWFALLEERAKMAGREDLENIPGIKLLDFFRKLRDDDLAMPKEAEGSEACSGPQFSTANAEALSGALGDAPPLAPSDATLWVEYWRATGFLAL
ncbi:hypothetical protein HYPSUDRAFT_862666 [Hypholoma sublateritium FD-334 SS-4]|uniref:Polyketide synthase-like phosphopantetheine-binding domain-containing protein n=1 Tax=Hypholoma sublateritium (strain FD-334 SS-4) TaxID=945553 RepID=A0A0D2P9I9_HYPSF|nr:hypothetical protein HYPSUDRAFT_862666 [Hypholoma sublateritium FD-334 SS-4]